jgi:cell division septal protein FtsQ
MKRRKFNSLPWIISVFLILLFVVGVRLAYRAFIASDYFLVKEVIVSGRQDREVDYLKGKNIFLIDLHKESEYIARYSPESLRVSLVRLFPDRIFVNFVQRRPVALVSLYRYFAVDESGVLFELPVNYQRENLIVISGLTSKVTKVIPGRKAEFKELDLALAVIKEIKRYPNLNALQIKRIDIEGSDYITMLISLKEEQKILEVRISRGNILEKIAVMSGLIAQRKNNLKDVKYIDLRFNEPVVNIKDDK